MERTQAVFITHAGENIGGGHLSRCFALSQGFEERVASCRWIINSGARPQAEALRISPENIVYVESPFTDDIASHIAGADFAVVDSYEPTSHFFSNLSTFIPILTIDDLADRRVEDYSAVVLNYGIAASPSLYRCDSAEYVLGPRFALIRKDFWEVEPTKGDNVVFVAGASDVLNASAGIVEMWRDDWPELLVIAGSLLNGEKRSKLEKSVAKRRNVRALFSPGNFADILANAGFVICSASVTSYEALSLRKRTALFTVAENQNGLGEALARMDAVSDLGLWPLVTSDKLYKAISFQPDEAVLASLVNKCGALEAAGEILKIMDKIQKKA
ncbi:hypothetical protein LJC31_04125 [Synergistaceae bacterium OttesenSCG-928-I11]|nr:hypothetical protein [Synergistaceae bacterium OttesenSCG-928-I11]